MRPECFQSVRARNLFLIAGADEPEFRKPKYSPAPGTKAKEAKMAASPPHPDPGAVSAHCRR